MPAAVNCPCAPVAALLGGASDGNASPSRRQRTNFNAAKSVRCMGWQKCIDKLPSRGAPLGPVGSRPADRRKRRLVRAWRRRAKAAANTGAADSAVQSTLPRQEVLYSNSDQVVQLAPVAGREQTEGVVNIPVYPERCSHLGRGRYANLIAQCLPQMPGGGVQTRIWIDALVHQIISSLFSNQSVAPCTSCAARPWGLYSTTLIPSGMASW